MVITDGSESADDGSFFLINPEVCWLTSGKVSQPETGSAASEADARELFHLWKKKKNFL